MTIPSPLENEERVRRPVPVREAPLRSASHAFRATPTSVAAATASEPARRVVEAAVETAYRVYDDYVSWGQKMAAERAVRDGRTVMGPKPLDVQGAATQWLQMWQELARVWMGALQPFMPGAPGMFPGVPNLQQMFEGFSPAAASVQLDLELETAQPARVSLQFVRKPAAGKLRAVLSRLEGEGRLALEFDAAHLRIKVGASQPAGTYSGVILDVAGQQVGMLSIHVLERSVP